MAPGGSSEMLKQGSLITDTEPTLDLEALIGKMVFGGSKLMRRIIAFMVFLCLFCSSVRPASGAMESATDAARRGADQILALLQDPAIP